MDIASKCESCQEAYKLSRNLFAHVMVAIAKSDGIKDTFDLKVQYGNVPVDDYVGSQLRLRWIHQAYESEIEVYSHNQQLIALLMGIRSIHKLGHHIRDCNRIIVEADIPYTTCAGYRLGESAHIWATQVAEYLNSHTPIGRTIIEHKAEPRAGIYKVRCIYKGDATTIPVEVSYTRIYSRRNAVPIIPINEHANEHPETRRSEEASWINHETQQLPSTDDATERRSTTSSYWRTVLGCSMAREPPQRHN